MGDYGGGEDDAPRRLVWEPRGGGSQRRIVWLPRMCKMTVGGGGGGVSSSFPSFLILSFSSSFILSFCLRSFFLTFSRMRPGMMHIQKVVYGFADSGPIRVALTPSIYLWAETLVNTTLVHGAAPPSNDLSS